MNSNSHVHIEEGVNTFSLACVGDFTVWNISAGDELHSIDINDDIVEMGNEQFEGCEAI